MTDAVQAAFIGAIVGAAVSGLVALVTTVLNNRYAEKRQKAEAKKWYAQFFLSRKLDSLSSLYSSMIHLHGLILRYIAHPTNDPAAILENVDRPIEVFVRELGLSWVYMSDKDRASINELNNEFLRARRVMLNAIPAGGLITIDSDEKEHDDEVLKGDRTLDIAPLRTAFNDFVDRMENLLSPDVLKEIEPEK